MQSEITFKNILSVIEKRIAPLAIIAILSIVLAIIFSGESFLKPRYKSSAIVYPINLDPYSDESETEQMLQLFDNENIRRAILEKFELGSRYGYKPEDKNYLFKINEMYNERVSISPTRYESVEIICQDEDPDVAKKMVEEVINQFNLKTQQLEREFHLEYFDMLTQEAAVQQGWLDTLNMEMVFLKNKSGIVDPLLQTEEITEGYMKMLEKNIDGPRMREVQKLLDGIREDGESIINKKLLTEHITRSLGVTLDNRSMEYSKVKRDVSFANVVKSPESTDKKHWPVRWLILAVALLSSLLAAVVFFIIIEK
ncbi:MAG: hypothetical protein ACI8XB_000990 [Patiriisocius sp.]|jgi:hypothetical protein